VTLRPATPEDSARLREWRNDPETVAASLSGRGVEPAEHEAWLERVLADPAERLFVIEENGEPVGQLRLQRRGEGTLEVHIGLAASARGRGLGRRALELAWEQAGGEPLVARVLAGNERSLRAFAAAGFDERSREGREVLLERRE
jgi:RimJ/RimL family protein N-acetyltransferase